MRCNRTRNDRASEATAGPQASSTVLFAQREVSCARQRACDNRGASAKTSQPANNFNDLDRLLIRITGICIHSILEHIGFIPSSRGDSWPACAKRPDVPRYGSHISRVNIPPYIVGLKPAHSHVERQAHLPGGWPSLSFCISDHPVNER